MRQSSEIGAMSNYISSNRSDKVDTSPKRKLKPTRRSISGVYMFRGETDVMFESALERDFIIRKEFNQSVVRVAAQPIQVPFIDCLGRPQVYTPDFLVEYALEDRAWSQGVKSHLVEVKEESEWRENWRDWLPKWKAAYRFAKDHNWHFSIHDESRIRDVVFQNVHFLERFKRMRFDSGLSAEILYAIEGMGSTPVHYLLARFFMGQAKRAEGVAHIWHLLAMRRLDCDMTLPLGDFTTLWVTQQ
jgi:hypothetical protein